ncbi:transcriptional regulator, IclR family [Granulicella pectinivorans]|uniref:Transcriptional regulator, IclR family n=1 Tax=Granulicella pectinivorans TaxID=474950 RepID=A0A1I6L5E8_9BACT|nr:IclR family transcriptional regulator [Granulicella pectinivorans]SFR98490.1 transcriptional regulator, IclR family [Granulicella pectinivorans]
MNASRTPSVPAVERALNLMESLAHSKNGLSLSQLVESSNIPKSSIHCLLLTLERAGYLHRSNQTGRYMFGLKLFGLANTSLSGLPIREQAAPFMMQLMEQTGLTVHLGVLDQYEAVLVAKFNPPGSNGLATWRGKRMEIHCTGIGKALGAYMSEADLKAIYRLRKFPRHNENTISTLRKLQEDFAKIRQRCYSIDDEEDEIGWRCLGAPIYDDAGNPVAAVSIAGTIHQIRADNLPRLAETLKACTTAISYSWGYLKGEEADAYQRA